MIWDDDNNNNIGESTRGYNKNTQPMHGPH